MAKATNYDNLHDNVKSTTDFTRIGTSFNYDMEGGDETTEINENMITSQIEGDTEHDLLHLQDMIAWMTIR
eukprot:1004376-Amphidinium_carterae.2